MTYLHCSPADVNDTHEHHIVGCLCFDTDRWVKLSDVLVDREVADQEHDEAANIPRFPLS